MRGLPSVAAWIAACLPFVDAYEAGLAFFWILEDEIVAVPRPALRVERAHLHGADGPAIEWPSGERYWFWNGIRVPQQVIEMPERISVADVHAEPNLEMRRVLLERMGLDRYVRDGGGKLVKEDRFGRLWRCHSLPEEREPLMLVEVQNSTREPDGTQKRYFLRVPPSMRTPREAIAWSFGLARPGRYHPLIET